MRNETEWIELVNRSYVKAVGANEDVIASVFEQFKNSDNDFSENLYGNNVGEKIYKSIVKLIQ